MIKTPVGFYSKIRTVIETVIDGEIDVYDEESRDGGFNTMDIIPINTIRHDYKWRVPVSVVSTELKYCSSVFSFVVEHPLYKTNNIINDLMEHPGWNDGYIKLKAECVKRDVDGNVMILLK